MPRGASDKIRASKFVVCAAGHIKSDKISHSPTKKRVLKITRGQGSDERKKSPDRTKAVGECLEHRIFFSIQTQNGIRLQFEAVENFTFVAEVFPKEFVALQKEVGMGRIVFRERDGAAIRIQNAAFDLFMAGDVKMPV